MKVICFVGNQGFGKSTTIKKILGEFFKINVFYPKRWKDFNLTLFYMDKKIGICNKGDTTEILEEGLETLKTKECEIIICARHKPNAFLDTIKKIFPNAEVIEITCKKPEVDNEEHWAIEHSKRIEEFKPLI